MPGSEKDRMLATNEHFTRTAFPHETVSDYLDARESIQRQRRRTVGLLD